MNFNLTNLNTKMDDHFREKNIINISLCPDNDLQMSKGNVTYYCDYKKLMKILELNQVDLKNDESVYDTLSKHILNQLAASVGKKIYPDVISTESDYI